MKYYEELGVKIFHNKDQETTDLEKCVYYVFENSESLTFGKKKESPKNFGTQDNIVYAKLIVLGSFGGRIDQTLNSIHVLSKMNQNF
jgi:thiamine pyrophosphokinase